MLVILVFAGVCRCLLLCDVLADDRYRRGAILLAVPAHHTSQTCPGCCHIAKENRVKQAGGLCVDCGYAENADVVRAINVLERRQRMLACAEDSPGRGRKTPTKPASVKPEPTEATMQGVSHA